MDRLFDTSTFVTFVVAAAALVATPGPGQALVLARTLQGGARAGLTTALGLEVGTLVHTLAAALGLSAVLATSATAFALVKVLGAAYLIALGVRALASRTRDDDETALPRRPLPAMRLLGHAAVTGTLNPKVALFFLAFLPQFADPARGRTFVQLAILGLTFALLGFLGDSLVALVAVQAHSRFAGGTRWQRWSDRVTGTVLIGLGVRLALAGRR